MSFVEEVLAHAQSRPYRRMPTAEIERLFRRDRGRLEPDAIRTVCALYVELSHRRHLSGDGSGFRLAGRVFEAVDIHVAETIAALARDRESGGG
jgi:hypothetical protein